MKTSLPDPVDLRVTNARVVTEHGVIRGGVAVHDGVIVDIGANSSLPCAEQDIDAENNFLLPGFIDPHVHLGRRDGEYREQLEHDFETETRGAMYGGVTTILNFLHQSPPYLPDLDFYRSLGEENSYIDFGYHIVVCDDHHIEEIEALAAEGITSFKMFFNMYKNQPELNMQPCEADRVYRVLKRIADMPNTIAMFHAENADLQGIRQREIRAQGRHDLRAWSEASPIPCETLQIEQLGILTEFTDSRSYVVHISPAEGAEIVRRYQDKGVNIFGETLVAYLVNHDQEDLGVWGKISPPVRSEQNRERLWKLLRQGALQHVGTDTVPASKELVEMGQDQHGEHMWDSPPGVQPIMEAFLPMMMTEGYNKNRLGIEQIVKVCSTNTAKRFGMYPRKGVIAEGSDADLVVVDPDKRTTINDKFYHSREPRWSPFHGRDVRGMPTHTIVRGKLAVEEGTLKVSPGGSHFLSR